MRTNRSFDRAPLGALLAIALAPLAAAGGGFTTASAGATIGAASAPIAGAQNDRMVLFAIPAHDISISEPLAPTARYLAARAVDRAHVIICVAGRPVVRDIERLEQDQMPFALKHEMPERGAAYLRLVGSGLIDVEPRVGVLKHTMPERGAAYLRLVASGVIDVEPALRADVLKHEMTPRGVALLRATISAGAADGEKAFTLLGAATPAEPLQPLGRFRLRPGERVRVELAVPDLWFEADPVLVLVAHQGR